MTDSYDIYHHYYYYYYYYYHHHYQNHHKIYHHHHHHHHYHDDDDDNIYPIYSIDVTYLLTCSRIIVSLRVIIIGATIVRLSIIKERPCLYIMFMQSDNKNENDDDDSNDDDDNEDYR
jgi:hypothetical protein